MGLRDLFGRAKKRVDERGGVESLKEDAQELRDIARGGGSATEKAKKASEAVRDPGAPGEDSSAPAAGQAGSEPPGGTPGPPERQP